MKVRVPDLPQYDLDLQRLETAIHEREVRSTTPLGFHYYCKRGRHNPLQNEIVKDKVGRARCLVHGNTLRRSMGKGNYIRVGMGKPVYLKEIIKQ